MKIQERWVFSETNGPHIRKAKVMWQDEMSFATFEEARQYAIKHAYEQIEDLKGCIEFWKSCREEDF
jgi:hypothetical protein